MSWYRDGHKVADNSRELIKYLEVHGQLDKALIQYCRDMWDRTCMAEHIITGKDTGCTRESAIEDFTSYIASGEGMGWEVEFYLEPDNWENPKPITYQWVE